MGPWAFASACPDTQSLADLKPLRNPKHDKNSSLCELVFFTLKQGTLRGCYDWFMENIVALVQQEVKAAQRSVEQLLREPTDRHQINELRASGESQRLIDVIYPLTVGNAPLAIRSALDQPQAAPWLRKELAKLDPTAYCLYLPEDTYNRVRKALPQLPQTPSLSQELAYTAAFVNQLAGEDLALYAHEVRAITDPADPELRRWQNLHHQLSQITRVLQDVQAQLHASGRFMHRLRSALH